MRIEVMNALAYVAMLFASSWDRTRWIMWASFGVALRLGFWGLLRPKELFGAFRKHLRLPLGAAFGSLEVAVLSVVEPKNRAFASRVQVRMVKDPPSVRWLCWACVGAPPSRDCGLGAATSLSLACVKLVLC